MHLAKLSGAARLFLVAVVGLCGLGDGLAVWNLRVDELHFYTMQVLELPFQ